MIISVSFLTKLNVIFSHITSKFGVCVIFHLLTVFVPKQIFLICECIGMELLFNCSEVVSYENKLIFQKNNRSDDN